MKTGRKIDKTSLVCDFLAMIHSMLGIFIWDGRIFSFPARDTSVYGMAMFDYVLCKALAVVALFFIYKYIAVMILPGRKDTLAYRITMKALWYLPVIVAVAAIKLPQGFLTNDEASIFNDAVNLTHSTWFNILTPYYYTVSLMIAPFKYAPIIFKMIIEFFVVGYVVLRCSEHYTKRVGLIAYLLFLLYPVIAYTTSSHRLPIYFLLYLFLFCKLYFDNCEGRKLSLATAVWMLLLGAVLTQWRTEGIYLCVLLPVLMMIAYSKSTLLSEFKIAHKDKKLSKWKKTGVLIAAAVITQIIVAIPQNAFLGAALDDAANDRMKPFWAYTITNMYRNGLDLEANREDLMIVDKYLSLEAIEKINEHYGDINYEDVLILYQDGFVGIREDAGVAEFVDYSDALKRIFINNPGVFVRTRIGAFNYAATPYHIDFSQGGIIGFAKGLISVVKSLAYNLYIPFAIVIGLLIFSLIKKNWLDFFVAGGLICHWFIVFILAPASYFKYYFPMYIMAYFYILLALQSVLYARGKQAGVSETEVTSANESAGE